MNKIVTKIYRIDPLHFNSSDKKSFIDKMLREHNEKSDNQFQRIPCEKGRIENFELELYVHIPRPIKPSWYGMLNEVTRQDKRLEKIQSKYPSFVMCFYDDEEIFAICGGVGGVKVIDAKMDTQFGFRIVECLIDPNKSDVRTASKIGLFGVELMSSRSFRANYVFSDEDNFGGFYKGLDVFIDKKKLQEIGVTTLKSKLLVRGEIGFKIDNKVSFNEIVNRIEKIRDLLKKDTTVELNPFRKLSRRDLNVKVEEKEFRELLDEKLENQFFQELDQHTEIYHPNLKVFLNSSRVEFKYPKLGSVEIETWDRFSIKGIFRKLGLEAKAGNFSKILHKIKTSIIDSETGKKEYSRPLSDWLNGEVELFDKKYLKLEDDWCTYSNYYESQIIDRIGNLFKKIEVKDVILWSSDFQKEACYNEALGKRKNSLNGDQIFHNRIELCDVVEFQDDQLIIYHFKMGFDRNIRILADQLINSAKIFAEFSNTDKKEELKEYFDKLLEKNEKGKSPLVSYANFLTLIQQRKLKFVFGILTNKEANTPEELERELCKGRSTIAKMALLNAYYSIKRWEYSFSIAKVFHF